VTKRDEQLAHALITYFSSRYQTTHGRPPLINRYKEKWAFLDMLADLGYDQSKAVIDFYLDQALVDHPLLHLFRNYEHLARVLREMEEDALRRAELREETKARVEEWRAARGTDGTRST